MGRKHTTYPQDQLKKLKTANRRLKSDINKLKSQLAELEVAYSRTKQFLHTEVENVPLEKLLHGAKENKTLEEIKPVCEKCSEKELTAIPSSDRIIYICTNCKHRFIWKIEN